MKEALFYESLSAGRVHCSLCPRSCYVQPGKFGLCGVRKNIDGKLFSLIYNKVSSVAIDPIEKKPLRHFHPGTNIYSIGTIGCNLHCAHCQNWQIAFAKAGMDDDLLRDLPVEKLIKEAQENSCPSIAWTYNEPTIWFEYALEGAIAAKAAGLYTIWVTNGYINPEPLDMIGPYLDVFRVDIKGFTADFYFKLAGIRDFQPVLDAAVRAKKKWKMHVEVITLIIPTMNDDELQLQAIARWIVNSLGADTVWHVTRFFPCLQLAHLPPTPIATLKKAEQIGLAVGLKFVYLGNV
ncbi:AmmeMemoRadiSam system radical SAM enzyme [Candidatus Saganbacteria bacterium]|nr:AmmeMemoRadiSam system radical SAM enzyme [Candidatus Saganbacteria bacterium]